MFRTDRERLTSFEEFRREKILPKKVYEEFPEFVSILHSMLNDNPEERPSATQLLALPVFAKSSKRELLNELNEKDKRVWS